MFPYRLVEVFLMTRQGREQGRAGMGRRYLGKGLGLSLRRYDWPSPAVLDQTYLLEGDGGPVVCRMIH